MWKPLLELGSRSFIVPETVTPLSVCVKVMTPVTLESPFNTAMAFNYFTINFISVLNTFHAITQVEAHLRTSRREFLGRWPKEKNPSKEWNSQDDYSRVYQATPWIQGLTFIRIIIVHLLLQNMPGRARSCGWWRLLVQSRCHTYRRNCLITGENWLVGPVIRDCFRPNSASPKDAEKLIQFVNNYLL